MPGEPENEGGTRADPAQEARDEAEDVGDLARPLGDFSSDPGANAGDFSRLCG
jgi:hypothetical protein